MSNVLLSSDSNELHERVLEASDGACVALAVGDVLESAPADLIARAGQSSLPDVVVLDATDNPEHALGLAARFDLELPGTGVVLIGDPDALAIAALRVGARDVLPPDVDADLLRSTLERVHAAVRVRRGAAGNSAPHTIAAVPAKVITVLSPKGGAGKTTIATNLAVGLARTAPGSTVLVDLDVQFGDVATALGLEPEFTLEDVVHGAALRDPIALKTHLSLHDSGLSVVCAPESPVAADSVTPDQVGALLSMLAMQFRYVVVDTAAGLEPRTLAALDQTTDPVLLTTFDVTGARGLRKEVDTLRELGMLNNARQVLLNFADSKSGLSVSDVEATIRTRVDITVPFSRAVTSSLNTGTPLVLQRPRDPVARQLGQLIAHFSGIRASGSRR